MKKIRIPMMLVSWVMCYAVFASSAHERVAPFVMPPSSDGKDAFFGGFDFEAPSVLAFDAGNRPYMFDSRRVETFGRILTLRRGKWVRLSFLEALRKTWPEVGPTHIPWKDWGLGTMAFDKDNALYALIPAEIKKGQPRWILVFSPDQGRSFQAHLIPGYPCLEIPTRRGPLEYPPAIGTCRGKSKKAAAWTNYNDFMVYVPSKKGKRRLVLGEPIKVTENNFGMSNHSGGYSFAASVGERVHFVYAEVAPDKKGNPTYAATIDRRHRKLIARKFLVKASPSGPDIHATPVICADSKGYLHVLSGAHGQSFFYLRSEKPDSVEDGWSEPVPAGTGQTYATLCADASGRLHSVFRTHPVLRYVNKAPDAEKWSRPMDLARAPGGHRGYTVWHQRLFIDAADALYLSFTYMGNDQLKDPYPRALIVSEDGGSTWKPASTETFMKRMAAWPGRRRSEST